MIRFMLMPLLFLAWAGPASAQDIFGDFFKPGPLLVHLELDSSLSRFGPPTSRVITAAGSGLLAIQGALERINSLRGDINSNLTCDNKRLSFSASITDFRIESDDKSLTLSANTQISQCTRNTLETLKGFAENVHGNIILLVILEPYVTAGGVLQFRSQLIARNSDVSAAYGLYKVSQKDIDNSTRDVGPKLRGYVSTLNSSLMAFFNTNPFVRASNLRLQKLQLIARGGDLVIMFNASGQAPVPNLEPNS
jgi:hypothetical protein